MEHSSRAGVRSGRTLPALPSDSLAWNDALAWTVGKDNSDSLAWTKHWPSEARDGSMCADLNGYAPERRLPKGLNWNTAHGLESGCDTCTPMEPSNCLNASRRCAPVASVHKLEPGARIGVVLPCLVADGAKHCLTASRRLLLAVLNWRAWPPPRHARINGTS
jgi:hypothetical protein